MKKAHLTRKTHKANMTFHFAPHFRGQINFWVKFAYHQTKLEYVLCYTIVFESKFADRPPKTTVLKTFRADVPRRSGAEM